MNRGPYGSDVGVPTNIDCGVGICDWIPFTLPGMHCESGMPRPWYVKGFDGRRS